MNRISEEERLREITFYDREYWLRDETMLAGMDEVGRGPLAGPVVAGCVIMPSEPLIEHVNDSKKVSEKRRAELYPLITKNAVSYSTGWIWQDTIDRINILEATKLAFEQAFDKMNIKPNVVLIDALKGLKINAEQHILIHGDALSYSIASASIIAKYERDMYMLEQDELYPQYGFAKNKGYGTKEHIDAIKKYGPCPIHRMSFIEKFI